jgi:hypothetical protein
MEKQNQKVDNFFRDALQHHVAEPSEAAKAAFMKDAATLKKTGKPVVKIYRYLTGILILLLIGAGIMVSQQVSAPTKSSVSKSYSSSIQKSKSTIIENKTKANETTLPLIASLSDSKKHLYNTTPNQNLQSPLARKLNRIQQKSKESSIINKSSSPVYSLLLTNAAKTPERDASSDPSPIPVTTTEGPLLKNESAKQVIQDSKPVNKDSISVSAVDPELNTKNTEKEKEIKHSSSVSSKHINFDAGLYYSPEWMNNTLEGEKYVNNFGLEGIFHFGNYSIRTGAGLSITKGTNELLIKTNDYLGNFNKLDSVNFIWDASHTHLIPTYYFTKKNVWDSIVKTQYSKIIKRYTYLQVPIILGYDFWKNDFITLGVRTGPILSILLKTEQLSENYDPGKDRVVQENLISPERIQTYWQFMAGIDAGFSISKRLSIELEPEIRYYFNSVYEQPQDNKKPWSMGFRAAFMIKN